MENIPEHSYQRSESFNSPAVGSSVLYITIDGANASFFLCLLNVFLIADRVVSAPIKLD